MSVPHRYPFFLPYRFLRITVKSAKRTEPLIVTVRFLVFDREPYRIKMKTVIHLLLRTVNRTNFGAVRFVLYEGAAFDQPKRVLFYKVKASQTASLISFFFKLLK
jgi:hypothetical protein